MSLSNQTAAELRNLTNIGCAIVLVEDDEFDRMLDTYRKIVEAKPRWQGIDTNSPARRKCLLDALYPWQVSEYFQFCVAAKWLNQSFTEASSRSPECDGPCVDSCIDCLCLCDPATGRCV